VALVSFAVDEQPQDPAVHRIAEDLERVHGQTL
jgi:hypothetical protein